jgi:DNA-binding CsgD family transcriptional regulator
MPVLKLVSRHDDEETGARVRSLADASRQARIVADEIGAADFAVFSIGAARERGRLTPLFDSDYPQVSPWSHILSSSFGDEIVRRAVSSTRPSWWSGERESASTRAFETLATAQRTALGLPDMPGIAFPVYGDQGVAGMMAFFGTGIALADDRLPVIHGRCFALFGEVTRLPPSNEAERRPAVSPRELEFLKLTANGYTSDEIAVVLNLSVHTTNQHLTRIAMKLNAVNRMHAVAKALRLGLIE